MEPIAILVTLVCLWFLINQWLLPLNKDRWKAANLSQKIARAGTLVVLEKVRDLAAIGAVMVAVVIVLVWIAGALSTASFAAPKISIDAIASVYYVARAWADDYASVLGTVSLIGAAIALFLGARHARQRISAAWFAKANEVHTRLVTNPSEIAAALQDPALRPMAQRLAQLLSLLAQQDQVHTESSLTEQELRQLREELSALFSMLAIEMAKKEVKFDTAIATPTDEEHRAPATLIQRWARALTSERFCKDLGFVKKPLSYVVTALFVVTLIGWTAEPLANSLQLAVNNLRVNVLNQDAGRDLDAALSKTPLAKAETPSAKVHLPDAATIQTATRLLARAVARELVRSPELDRLAQTERPALSEAEFVRASIVQSPIDDPKRADTATRVRREVAETIATNPDDTAGMMRLQESVGRELHPYIDRLHKENPSQFALLIAKLEARYTAPLSPLDAQGNLIARMLDEVLGGIDTHPSTELGKQSQKLTQEFGKEAVKTWVNAFAKTYMTDAILETARGDVVARAGSGFGFEASGAARQLARELQAAEDSGWVGSIAAREEARQSQAVAKYVADQNHDSRRMAITESLSGYDGLFPSGGGGGGDGPRPAPRAESGGKAFVQSRATNFHIASRSFRVRGVLIGQEMAPNDLDVKDLRWTLRPASVKESTRIKLEIRVDRQWVDLGSYDAAVVNQALRYAADRRVIATTITAGDGKVVSRVTYLHPALTDTPLGCRIVEADRFIDTFSTYDQSSCKPVAMRLEQLASDRQQIARWTATIGLAQSVAAIPAHDGCPREEIEDILKSKDKCTRSLFGSVNFSNAVASSFERFLNAEEEKRPGSTTFLRNANACAVGQTEALAACLCEKVKGKGVSTAYWFPEDHTSQFRERQAEQGRDLLWMKRSGDRLASIDLWVHTTFALHKPIVDGKGGDPEEATAMAVDFPTGQLDLLKRVIAQELPGYLKGKLRSPTYDDFMMPLEDFVLLQRFFRAALAGSLGRDVPLAKLIQLERDTSRFVPYQSTIRWEPTKDSASSFVNTLNSADPKAADTYTIWQRDAVDRARSKKPVCDPVSR